MPKDKTKPKAKRVRGKRWCFTLNNPKPEEEEFILSQLALLKNKEKTTLPLTYIIIGREAVSTPHLQGYLELSQKISLSGLKNFLSRAHWEKAKGTAKQASNYCKKEGKFEEEGVLSVGQGTRTDLQEVKKKIEAGATELEIADQYFEKWVVYRRSFQRYATLISTKRRWRTVTHVYWGKTGTGKTRFCYDQVMDSTFWTPGDYQWFDGYCGQKVVLLDDYRGEYKLQMLLKLLDRYEMSVPVKGGFTTWAPRKVYITSNVHPNDWYPNADRFSVAALFRRFDLVEACFDSLY
jgi:hypothetical protein